MSLKKAFGRYSVQKPAAGETEQTLENQIRDLRTDLTKELEDLKTQMQSVVARHNKLDTVISLLEGLQTEIQELNARQLRFDKVISALISRSPQQRPAHAAPAPNSHAASAPNSHASPASNSHAGNNNPGKVPHPMKPYP